MSNKEKYKEIFIKSLSIDDSKFNEKLKYNEIPEWDSIGHMTLMSGLEDGFNISLETDDIVDFRLAEFIYQNIMIAINIINSCFTRRMSA